MKLSDYMVLLNITDLEIKKFGHELSYMTYDFNMDNDVDIKPIAKNAEHFRYWSVAYPFYANVVKEGIILKTARIYTRTYCQEYGWRS